MPPYFVLSHRLKRFVIIAVVLVVLVSTFLWLFGHSYITVDAGQGGDATFSYTIYSQKSKTSQTFTHQPSHIKKLVTHGTYEVSVIHADTSYFAVVDAPTLMGSANIAAKMMDESARSFIGDSPGYCMQYDGNALVSNNCGGLYSAQKTHISATASVPTYAVPNGGKSGILEGLARTPNGIVSLVTPVDDIYAHEFYSLSTKAGETTIPKKVNYVSDLTPEKTYSLKGSPSGLYVYDSTYSEVVFYASPASKGTKVTIKKPDDPSLGPVNIDTNTGGSLVLIYSNNAGDAKNSKLKKKSVVSVLAIGATNTQTNYNFDAVYNSGGLCGAKKLCLLSGKTLDIYSLGDKTATLAYSVSGVSEVVGDVQPLVVNSLGLMSLNTDTRTGHYLYTFGDYTYGNLQKSDTAWLLAVADKQGKRAALIIDPSQKNVGSIDKKILELAKSSAVNNISIYGSHIYVSVNRGNMVYNPATRTSDYDQNVVQAAVASANKAIDDSKIDRKTYTFAGLN
jgi:hypothetical protein